MAKISAARLTGEKCDKPSRNPSKVSLIQRLTNDSWLVQSINVVPFQFWTFFAAQYTTFADFAQREQMGYD